MPILFGSGLSRLGEKGIFLSTYDGKFILNEGLQNALGDNVGATIERNFNAEGRYVFSIQEAINLLEGRSVLKPYVSMDGVEKIGWLKAENGTERKPLQFYFTGGQTILPAYDLASVLEKLLTAIDVVQKTVLIESLLGGDLLEVKLRKNGKDVSRYIQAAPETKSISMYDDQMKPMKVKQLVNDVEKIKQHKTRGNGRSIRW